MMEELVREFQKVDAGLRIVASLKPTSWEIEYVRDSLRGEYEDDDFERAYRSLVANQVSSDDFGHVGDFGDLSSQVYFFDKVVVFQFPSSRYEGVFVSFDRDEAFPVNEVVRIANETS